MLYSFLALGSVGDGLPKMTRQLSMKNRSSQRSFIVNVFVAQEVLRIQSAIKQTISNEDPDVVMFVEFSDEHEENLKDYINEKYPYFDKTNRSRIFG